MLHCIFLYMFINLFFFNRMDYETDKQWFSASRWLAVSLGVPKDQVIFIRTFIYV